MAESSSEFDTDVIVVGSGFGGAVAALRFAEGSQRVTVLERGPWVKRSEHEVTLDALWDPKRHRFGANQLKGRGRNIIPWLGAGVGGGSHVYAATMKRAVGFEGFPDAIQHEDMDGYYERAEDVMAATPYPDYAPYSDVRATRLLFEVGERLQNDDPELVEEWGPINLAISFAPEGGEPGAEFTNKHGAKQRYSDPDEQSLLGGDIDAKNSLDKNYLFLAQEKGAEIRDLCEADKVEPLEGGGYRVHFTRYKLEASVWKRFSRRWLGAKARNEEHSLTCKQLVLAAGSVGSTEILLRNRDVHKTLPRLGPSLGHRYSSNRDFINLIFPAWHKLLVSWVGFAVALVALFMKQWWIAGAGGIAYFIGLLLAPPPFDPDIGTTNSDYIRFRGADGSPQGAYVESGRYPTPIRAALAALLSALGLWRSNRYSKIIAFTNVLRLFVPPFALLARTWPIPLLMMGRDEAFGVFKLDKKGRAIIDFDLAKNAGFYRYMNGLGRLVAKSAGASWLPNFLFYATKKLEIPHNQGGVPMADDPIAGVVDHAGRVYGYPNLMVLDGSIMPVSPGPNPALTILALAERAMEHITPQAANGDITAELSRERGLERASVEREAG